jgi:pimeloyl-ACP methyl ester carboxylesterase
MQILLIHGLARTSFSLASLEGYLKQSGYSTEHFGYFAFAEKFDHIVERLRQKLAAIAQQGPYAVVAHSLGGVLTRAALAVGSIQHPAHVVMLGPPNQPPRLAPLAWKLPPFQWFTGQCGFNLSNAGFYANLPPLKTDYTIIAGTSGPRGVLSPFGDEVNDGIVALSETRMSEADTIVELPVWHTFMMNHPAVQATVLDAVKGR